jgi:hypothetical protein
MRRLPCWTTAAEADAAATHAKRKMKYANLFRFSVKPSSGRSLPGGAD